MQSNKLKELKEYAGKLWDKEFIGDSGAIINKLLTMIGRIPDQSPQHSKDVEAEAKEYADRVAIISFESEEPERHYNEKEIEKSFIAGAKWAEQAKETVEKVK